MRMTCFVLLHAGTDGMLELMGCLGKLSVPLWVSVENRHLVCYAHLHCRETLPFMEI